ncbi:MAG: class I SAM-dependent methyltransferase family protein [Candidatus Aenigmarchaeota archaeon]|nr:class I SAM-dependent methyltransferase family protein [Candidatus Aenigmarchaeota archaeon]
MALREQLRGKLTSKELKFVPTSFDVIGNKDKAVAIIEIPEQLQEKKKIVAEGLMKQHKNVKSVLEKSSPRKGEFRIRKMKLIAGLRNTEVIHLENKCRYFLDPKTSYFSPREGTERQRILEHVRENETVMVFFAGVGPFAIQIAKHKKAARIIGIEKNLAAVKYFRKNIKLNKLTHVEAVLGDVKTKSKKYYGQCDRIIMPLPETAENYLEYAINCLKDNGMIHLYFFCEEENLEKKKEDLMNKISHHITISVQKVLPYGPKIWKYRADIKVSKKN